MISWPRYSCTYSITGTKFLRLGSSAIFDTYGGNAQNWQGSLRVIFVPDGFNTDIRHKYVAYLKTKDLSIFTEEERATTKVFVNRDQSGAEALVVGKLCKKGNAIEQMFDNGIKPHSYIATRFPDQWREQFPFIDELAKERMSIPDCAKDARWKALDKAVKDSDNNDAATRYYFHYKGTCHSGNYDARANKLQMKLLEDSGGKVALTKQQSEEYLMGYHGLVPEVREWHYETQQWVRREKGRIYNCFGYPIEFTSDLSNDSDMRDVYAAVPQSTVGTLTNIVYTKLQTYIEEHQEECSSWDLLQNGHDAILGQCLVGHEDRLAEVMGNYFMKAPMVSPLRNETFFMKSETQIGFNWGKAKKPKEPVDEFDPLIIDKMNLDGLR